MGVQVPPNQTQFSQNPRFSTNVNHFRSQLKLELEEVALKTDNAFYQQLIQKQYFHRHKIILIIFPPIRLLILL